MLGSECINGRTGDANVDVPLDEADDGKIGVDGVGVDDAGVVDGAGVVDDTERPPIGSGAVKPVGCPRGGRKEPVVVPEGAVGGKDPLKPTVGAATG
eukprot:g63289.t1